MLHEIDLAPGLTQTPAGLRLWQFSDPYMRVPQLLVGARNGTGSVVSRSTTTQRCVRMGVSLNPQAGGSRSIVAAMETNEEALRAQWRLAQRRGGRQLLQALLLLKA